MSFFANAKLCHIHSEECHVSWCSSAGQNTTHVEPPVPCSSCHTARWLQSSKHADHDPSPMGFAFRIVTAVIFRLVNTLLPRVSGMKSPILPTGRSMAILLNRLFESLPSSRIATIASSMVRASSREWLILFRSFF